MSTSFQNDTLQPPGYVKELSGKLLEENLRRTITTLLTIPKAIREIQEGPYFGGEITSLKNLIKELKTQALGFASMDRDENGKAKYTNDAQREARANELMRTDPVIAPEYQKLSTELRSLEKEQFDINAKISHYEELSKVYRAMLPAMVALYERETLVYKYRRTRSDRMQRLQSNIDYLHKELIEQSNNNNEEDNF